MQISNFKKTALSFYSPLLFRGADQYRGFTWLCSFGNKVNCVTANGLAKALAFSVSGDSKNVDTIFDRDKFLTAISEWSDLADLAKPIATIACLLPDRFTPSQLGAELYSYLVQTFSKVYPDNKTALIKGDEYVDHKVFEEFVKNFDLTCIDLSKSHPGIF